jgi:hypothetical protein
VIDPDAIAAVDRLWDDSEMNPLNGISRDDLVRAFSEFALVVRARSTVAVAAEYCDRIVDGRTQGDVLKHLKGEVKELEDEVLALKYPGEIAPGPDGIFGEAIDIMACCIDIIRRERPTATLAELEAEVTAYMVEKCEKWLVNVEARKYDHQRD